MDEVAMFIDFENLRYGLLNHYGDEPDIQSLVEKAQKYGRTSLMKAYADFSEHPEELKRQLHIAGIDVINVLAKRRTVMENGQAVVRIKNAADMFMAIDAIIEGRQADNSGKQKIFIIVTGDRDYVKLVTQLKNVFGQKVIIVGVPGCVARDLEIAAGQCDHIKIKKKVSTDKFEIKKAIVAMIKKGPSPLTYWSPKLIDQWINDPRQNIPGNAVARRDMLTELFNEGVLVKGTIKKANNKGEVANATLNEDIARKNSYL